MGALLAHQGGWDEGLLVAIPVAAFALLVWRAKRNAEAERANEPGPGDDAQPTSPPDDEQ